MKPTIILIVLIIILSILILRLFTVNEGFKDQSDQITDKTKKDYAEFLGNYGKFCANWQKAIESSVASEIVQKPLTDPSQIQATTSPNISDADMNNYIIQLSQQLSQPFPPICKTLPTDITTTNIEQTIQQIPSDIVPYKNALKWLNKEMANSHAKLDIALTEGFSNTCDTISACLANNPALIGEISKELKEQNIESVKEYEAELEKVIQPFLDPDFTDLLATNIELFKKSQQIQNEAQSGELIKRVNIPGGNTIAKYTMPEGANTLQKMKNTNPAQYNDLQQNYSKLFGVKQLLEQINSTL